MRITLIDDSIPFDGYTPTGNPLGGAEKAFASLPGALVRRGHQVTVFNRCRFRMTIEGAQWEPWETERPAETDILIAYRKPGLLGGVRGAGKRLLWVSAAPRYLGSAAAKKALDQFKPIVVLIGRTQHQAWSAPSAVRAVVIAPGLRYEYMAEQAATPMAPPRAIVTTHPLHGLDWLLTLWSRDIHPKVPAAQLHIYSNVLDRGAQGGEVPEEVRPVLAQALAVRDRGVVIVPPKGDFAMAGDYRQARAHLYPGHAEDMGCFTLIESQSCGVPAVVRPLGAAPERIRNGETGNAAPDDAAFANLTIRLLTDDGAFWGMNREAALHQRQRGWDQVAAEFEAVFK
ncbi:MAG: glycosyltransferase [Rhodospirillales bacterium]|nr:glycosyltransferase [Rhodospirillales bacterium]